MAWPLLFTSCPITYSWPQQPFRTSSDFRGYLTRDVTQSSARSCHYSTLQMYERHPDSCDRRPNPDLEKAEEVLARILRVTSQTCSVMLLQPMVNILRRLEDVRGSNWLPGQSAVLDLQCVCVCVCVCDKIHLR